MRDHHRLGSACGIAALGAALGLLYCLCVYGWMQGHSGEWGYPTDYFIVTKPGSLLLHGDLKAVYSTTAGLYALPLSLPLTGLSDLIAGWAHLAAAPRPEWIFVAVPFFCGLAVPALYQVRAVVWDLGLRRHLWAVQVLTAALVIPPLVEWGHPEDVLALAFILSAVRWLIAGDPLRACLHLSVAVSFKQWAVMLVPLGVVAAEPGRRLRALVAAAALPVALACAFLAIDFHHALHAFTDPSTDVVGYPGHPSVLGEWLGARSSQITRLATVVLAAGLAYKKRNMTADAMGIVTASAAILMLRPLLETINYSYYWPPALVLVIAAMASRRGSVRALDWMWPLLCLAWTLPRSNDLTALDWWLGEGLLLAVSAYRLWQAGRAREQADHSLLDQLLARPQPAEVAG